MLLAPRRTKYNKKFARRCQISLQKQSLLFRSGDQALSAAEGGFITSRQLEAARKLLRRSLRKTSKMWICLTPQYPVTKKPQEVRMGKGKGGVKYWTIPLRTGRVFLETTGFSRIALAALKMAQYKLSVKANIVRKQ